MDNSKDHPHWTRMRFKRNKVWLAVDDKQQPVLEKGKVLIKYQLDQPHEYWVHPNSVRALDDSAPAPEPKRAAPKKAGAAARRSAAPKATGNNPPDTNDAPAADAICIYTDGACSGNPGPAGIGIVMIYKGHRKEISRYIGQATNNIAELEAIRVGLESVRNRDLSVVLYSDSTYSLGLLTKGWKAKQNQELVQKVRSLVKKFKNLKFVKIKGHAGHAENERADQLAVEAVQSANGG